MRLGVNDRGAHLYVLQAESGYIKIGRSDEPEKRAKSIQQNQATEVILVHVARGMGHTETHLLVALAGRRVRGEWLDGTMAARDAIETHVGQSLHWPYRTPNQKPEAGRVDDELLQAAEAARFCGIALPTFWRSVRDERLPAPIYPAARAPRWFKSELRAALERSRARPVDNMVRRMTARRARMSEERRLKELAS